MIAFGLAGYWQLSGVAFSHSGAKTSSCESGAVWELSFLILAMMFLMSPWRSHGRYNSEVLMVRGVYM